MRKTRETEKTKSLPHLVERGDAGGLVAERSGSLAAEAALKDGAAADGAAAADAFGGSFLPVHTL